MVQNIFSQVHFDTTRLVSLFLKPHARVMPNTRRAPTEGQEAAGHYDYNNANDVSFVGGGGDDDDDGGYDRVLKHALLMCMMCMMCMMCIMCLMCLMCMMCLMCLMCFCIQVRPRLARV